MSFLQPKPATSTSSNVNNGLITKDYSGQIANGTGANNVMSSLLTGTGDTQAANDDYTNYLQKAGYAPAMAQMSQGVVGQGAASGLLNSGATAEALQNRGANLNNQFYNNYLQNLTGLSNAGTQAGQLVSGTGNVQKSTAGSPGLLSTIASAAGGVAGVLGGPAGFAAGSLGSKIFGG